MCMAKNIVLAKPGAEKFWRGLIPSITLGEENLSLEVKQLFGGSSSKQAQPSGSSTSSESLLCRAERLYKKLKDQESKREAEG